MSAAPEAVATNPVGGSASDVARTVELGALSVPWPLTAVTV